jgi:hypothetical protein
VEQPVEVLAAVRVGDAEAQGERQQGVAGPDGLAGDGVADPVRELRRPLRVGLRQQRDQLVAAVASEQVAGPQQRPAAPGDLAERRVAGAVPVGVVDLP